MLPIGREEIGELRQAASYDWRDVDPSIFGTLLEQALDKNERRQLGAHYTPRAYVERLVDRDSHRAVARRMEPCAGHDRAQARGGCRISAARSRRESALADARKLAEAFHKKLCETRVLDPACGTGNFLYVALELMKRLEGEVMEAVELLGGQERATWLEGRTSIRTSFLGWRSIRARPPLRSSCSGSASCSGTFAPRANPPSPPILQAFKNIQIKDAVLDADISLARDASGKPITRPGPEGCPMEVYRYDNPRCPEWPDAEFIVGNPPFIGKGELMRAAFGQAYSMPFGRHIRI